MELTRRVALRHVNAAKKKTRALEESYLFRDPGGLFVDGLITGLAVDLRGKDAVFEVNPIARHRVFHRELVIDQCKNRLRDGRSDTVGSAGTKHRNAVMTMDQNRRRHHGREPRTGNEIVEPCWKEILLSEQVVHVQAGLSDPVSASLPMA